jgi:hypothetical protein
VNLVASQDFLEMLIKRSADAELVLIDCGRIRFQRAIAAAIQLYCDLCPPGGHNIHVEQEV